MADKKKKDEAASLELTGTTLRVYRYLYRMGKPCGLREIQRGLRLSSSSVALYHVRKLLDAGLIREESKQAEGQKGTGGRKTDVEQDSGSQNSVAGSVGYVVDRLIYDNLIRIRRSLIPVQVAYSVFFATAFIILLVILRPKSITGDYSFALFVIAVGCGIFTLQAFRTVSKKQAL